MRVSKLAGSVIVLVSSSMSITLQYLRIFCWMNKRMNEWTSPLRNSNHKHRWTASATEMFSLFVEKIWWRFFKGRKIERVVSEFSLAEELVLLKGTKMHILAPIPGVCGRQEGESWKEKERFNTIGFSLPCFMDVLSTQHRFPTTDKTINKRSHPPRGLDEAPPRKALPRRERMPTSSLECAAWGFIWVAAWGKEKNRSQKSPSSFTTF